MKQKHLVVLAAACILIAAAAYLFISGQPRVGETDFPAAPATPAGPTKPEQGPVANNAHSPHRQDNGPERFFDDVGPMHYPLDLDRKTVFERITAARAKLVIQTQMLTDARVESMMDAYKRMMNGAIFMGGTEPTWGVEDSEYFYFTGRRQRQPSTDAFSYGHAVRKDNGRIYAWFPPQSDK